MIISVVMCNTETSSELDQLLKPMEGQIKKFLRINYLPLSGPGIESVLPLSLNESAAGVLVIDSQLIGSPQFCDRALACIEEASRRDDFRLFVFLKDVSREEIKKLATQGNSLFAELVDTIQLPESFTSDLFVNNLVQYLQMYDAIRNKSEWRRWRLAAMRTLGWIAKAVQILCVAMVLPLALAEQFNLISGLAWFEESLWPLIVSALTGVAIVPLLTVPIYLLGLGFGQMSFRMNNDRAILKWFFLGALATPLIGNLPSLFEVSNSWLFWGLSAGIVVDIWRRAGLHAIRSQLPLDVPGVAKHANDLHENIETALRGSFITPLVLPIMPHRGLRIVISYARGSSWSNEQAVILANRLEQNGATVFLDQTSIGEGSSWRRLLHSAIADSDVFISILDHHATSRNWVAAEMETALKSQGMIGIPEVVVLLDQDLDDRDSCNRLAVFQAILESQKNPSTQGGPRVITMNESTMDSVSASLKPERYRSFSIVPHQLSAFFEFFMIPLTALGAFGTILGFCAGGIWMTELWQDSAIALKIEGTPWLGLFCVFLAYLAGYTIHMAFASKYEVKAEQPQELFWINVLATLGFYCLLSIWLPFASLLVTAWCFVVAVLGWHRASSFFFHVGLGNKDFLQQD